MVLFAVMVTTVGVLSKGSLPEKKAPAKKSIAKKKAAPAKKVAPAMKAMSSKESMEKKDSTFSTLNDVALISPLFVVQSQEIVPFNPPDVTAGQEEIER